MSVEILEKLKKAVIEYDSKGAASLARKVIDDGIDPIKALDALTEGIKQVGDGFGREELWLTDLMSGATAMQSATSILVEEIKRIGVKRKTLATIVIGTVHGDIHDIGKTMVAALATANGFEVIDLGVDVRAEGFVDAIKRQKAGILCMSSLMTTTASEQRNAIKALEKEGIRENVKIAVGGGAINLDFAEEIGADGYAPTAPLAIGILRKFVGPE